MFAIANVMENSQKYHSDKQTQAFQIVENGSFYQPPSDYATQAEGDGVGQTDGVENSAAVREKRRRREWERIQYNKKLKEKEGVMDKELLQGKYSGMTGAQLERQLSEEFGISKRGLNDAEKEAFIMLIKNVTCTQSSVFLCTIKSIELMSIECEIADKEKDRDDETDQRGRNREHHTSQHYSDHPSKRDEDMKDSEINLDVLKDPSMVMCDIVNLLTTSILQLTLPWANKIARLYVVHDILLNTACSIKNIGRFRGLFQAVLPEIFAHLGVCFRSHVSGRMTAKNVNNLNLFVFFV